MMNTEPSKHSRKRFVVATIAMVLLTALSVTRTSNAPASAHSIPDLDLKSEDGALSLFGEGSVRFDKQLAEFRNASSLSY